MYDIGGRFILLDTYFISFSNRGINLEFSQIHNLSYYLVSENFCCCLLFGCFYPNDGFPSGSAGKELACQCRRYKRSQFYPWVGKVPWRRKGQPAPVLMPGKYHGQRSLVNYSPWCHKDSDMTEHACTHM